MERTRVDTGPVGMRLLFLLVTLSAPLMPSVPEFADVRAHVVARATGLLLLIWLAVRLLAGSVPRSLAGACLLFFLVIVGLSALTASLFGTDLSLWLRGATPFLFLVVFFPAYELAREDPSWVLRALGIAAIAWLMVTVTESVSAVSQVISGEVQRITHATEAWAAFQLPYAMVGLALVLFHPPVRAVWIRWPLAIAFTVLPLLAVSRGQIVAVTVLWATYVFLQPQRARMNAAALAVLVAAGFSVVLVSSELGSSVLQRFSATGSGDDSRAAELRYAWEQFTGSPLIGKGLGHQIPAEITFLGDWSAILDSGVASVGYMHNVVGYLLMDLGLLGFLAYAGFVIAALRDGWKARCYTNRGVLIAAGLALGCLLWWFMIQASFRQIQSNLLLATLAAVLAASAVRRSSAYHA